MTTIAESPLVRNSLTGPSARSGSVYRYYDAKGTLLYIGVTCRGGVRNLEHSMYKEWWSLVSSQDVTHYETYEQALAEEKRLITECRPPFNVQHNPHHAAIKAAYLQQAAYEPDHTANPDQLYSSLQRRIPLRKVAGRDESLTLATDPDHYPLIRLIRPIVQAVAVYLNGAKIGRISSSQTFGNIVYLRGVLALEAVLDIDAWAKVEFLSRKMKDGLVWKRVLVSGARSEQE